MTETPEPGKSASTGGLEGWLVVAAFLGPLLLAVVWYTFRDVVPVPAPRSEGTLVAPARPLESFRGATVGGDVVGPEYFRGRWTLAYVAGAGCDLRCEALLFKVRQLRLSLGRDLPRVQWVALAPAGWRAPDLEGTVVPVLRVDETPAAFGNGAAGRLFIVDPHANVMMQYEPESDIRGMQKDLKRLLKASKIG